jgi:hypothetical protein
MRVIALVLSPRYQLLSEATPRTIVGTEGTMKVLLPEYQFCKCFIILNNCAIKNFKIQVLLPSYSVNKCIMFDVVIIPLAGQLVSQRLNIHYGLKTNRASFTTISHTCINKHYCLRQRRGQ